MSKFTLTKTGVFAEYDVLTDGSKTLYYIAETDDKEHHVGSLDGVKQVKTAKKTITIYEDKTEYVARLDSLGIKDPDDKSVTPI